MRSLAWFVTASTVIFGFWPALLWLVVDPPDTSPATTATAAPAPNPPTHLVAFPVSATRIDLGWQDNSTDEGSFVVERSPNGTTAWAVIATLPAGTIHYCDTGLQPQTTYYYRVKASTNPPPPVTASIMATGGCVTLVVPPLPLPQAPPVYGYTLHDPGLSPLLATWKADVVARGSSNWWPWGLAQIDVRDDGRPDLIIGQHYSQCGSRFFRADPVTLTYADITADLGGTWHELGGVGHLLTFDFDGDGAADFAPKDGSGPDQDLWRFVNGQLARLIGQSFDGANSYIQSIGDFDSDDDVDAEDVRWPIPTQFNSWDDVRVRRFTNNGNSTFTGASTPWTFPAGIPQAVIDDCFARLKSATADEGRLFLLPMDLDDDGDDDLVIAGYFSYEGGKNFAYFLERETDSYSDATAKWGLPRTGTFLPLMPAAWSAFPRVYLPDIRLHKLIGQGSMTLFVGGGGGGVPTAGGYFKWNGAQYVKQTGTLTTRLIDSVKAAGGSPDDYQAQLYTLDLDNDADLDLVYHRPRSQLLLIFINSGTGTFSQVSGVKAKGAWPLWDAYDWAVTDPDDNGLLDLLLLGLSPTTGNGPGNAIAGLLRNATANPGHYVKVRLRRTGSLNPFGVGGVVEVYDTETEALIGVQPAIPSGVPMHFGVGGRETVHIRVSWPGGGEKVLDAATDQTITITGE